MTKPASSSVSGKTTSDETGQALNVSRRHVSLLTKSGIVSGTIASRALDLVTGDRVVFEKRDGRVFVTSVIESSRCLSRSYRGSLKRMGANIDLLCVITAVGPAFNPNVIDRMLVAARLQDIPAILVVNKIDLDGGLLSPILEEYEKIGISVIKCSAKLGDGVEPLERLLRGPDKSVIALCGVSGVGKSTILNRLVPGASARTGEVSERTGQGKQTTSQPKGFLYNSSDGMRRIIIDFPGVGFFGLSHVARERLAAAFDELAQHSRGCRFVNCRHLQEPECGVRQAVESGEIAPWRYESYIKILDEIEDAREY